MNEEACLQYLKWMAIPGLYAPVDVRTLDDDKDDENDDEKEPEESDIDEEEF